MAIHDTVAGTTDQADGPSRLETKQIDLHTESQATSQSSSSIETMNNMPPNDDTTANSQSKENIQSIGPSIAEAIVDENQQSCDNGNGSLDEAPKTIAKKKHRNFLDSDSEEEDDVVPSLLDKSNSDEEGKATSESLNQNKTETSKASAAKGKNYRCLIDSDSEDDDIIDMTKNSNTTEDDNDSRDTVKKNIRMRVTRAKAPGLSIDSDSNDNIVDKAKKFNISDEDSDSRDTMKKKINALVDSESEDNNASKHATPYTPVEKRKKITSDRKKNRKTEKTATTSKLSALIDTDSEGDIEVNGVQRSSVERLSNSGHSAKKNEKSAKKRTGSHRASKEEAMRQIHSETQRLIRTSEVSLPYHRPKQRSLQDFLNRKNFIPALPQGLTTAAKVKMSSEIVGKVLEEKEKEAELFYKSSDSEDETVSCTPANLKDTKESSHSESTVDQYGIEETQKLLRNDVQNAHNKKEIIKQGAVDIGVPRKLFVDGSTEFTENDGCEEKNMEDEESFDCEDPRKKLKETKHGLREVSVPRKLFSCDYDEGVGSPSQNYDVSTLATSNTTSKSSEMVEGPSKSVDEGIDSLGQENELSSKSEGSSCKNNDPNVEGITCNTAIKESAELSNISETPFVSNKEIGRAKEKDKMSRQSVDPDENLFDKNDPSEPRNYFGHVIGLPPPDMDEDNPKKNEKVNIKSKVLSTISTAGPKLRGAPGMVIDLSDDVKPNKDGVKSLLDRFYRHSVVKKCSEEGSPVTVLHTEKTADGLRVVEQILPYKLPKNDSFNDKELSKPGAKHFRLKSELIEKMAKKRGEEWKLKEQREKEEEEERESDEIEEGYDDEDAVKLIEEEIEDSGESEPEEDDMPEKKKNKRNKTSEFVDEEAEVSGEDDDEVMEIDSENNEENEDDDEGENANENDDESGDDASNSDAETQTANKSKKLSRIVKAFEDDSNSLPEAALQIANDCRAQTFQRNKTDIDMFETEDSNGGWLSDAESDLPPSQVLPCDQLCKTPLTAVNVLRFVSPITQLTVLNSAMDSPKDCSATKSHSVSSQDIGRLSMEKTPIDKQSPNSGDSEKRNGFQKKLFQEPAGTVNDEELMDLCSGSFTGIETDNRDAQVFASNAKLSADNQTSQLLRLSSGSFFSQAIDSQTIEKSAKPDVDETSQDIRLTLDENSQDTRGNMIVKEMVKESSVSRAKFKVASSSDDEDENVNEPKRKKKVLGKKKVKQLELSDDEDETGFSNEDEEEDEILGDNDTDDKYVDYDSEENEVVIVPKKDIKKVAADFLDAEAELSESDWGSADEDEKDLDKLEMEEGDDEEIDENKMRDQLGKMHMRQILDDDKRDVRMLQELLFDDGDLHTDGSGRERKFKWKNIDKLGEDGNVAQGTDDGDENTDQLEEENDLEWRKLRLEREKFIQEKMDTPTGEIHGELTNDSTLFKLGIKALNKRKLSHCDQKDTEDPTTKKPIVPRTVMDLMGTPADDRNSKILHKAVKRGSFLARGDESLARLAVQIKHTETTIAVRQKPGNFVFTHISPSVAGIAGKEDKNVTESEAASPANAKARKRKPAAGITPRTAKKAKVDVSRSTGKKLF